jgi:fructose-bisphosphate aldolase, class I
MKIRETVLSLMRQGRGILAADESSKTFDARLQERGIPQTEEMHRAFRELLFTTPGIENYLSGVILYDETIRQALVDGTPFADYLIQRNIHVGIKVDQGLVSDPQFDGGEVTKGLEGLPDRLKEYKELGATFTKWRAVTTVGTPPGSPAMRENASRMAAYAEAVLAEGMVPIVEPEVLMEGVHTAAEAEDQIAETLAVVVDALHARDIELKNVIIKTAMAVAGSDTTPVPPEEVAERTVRALTTALPEEIGGVVFLSGGQSPEEATANLNAIARLEPLPWDITFSYSRALQNPVMDLWQGQTDTIAEAQAKFSERLALAVAADAAGYSKTQEEEAREGAA